MPITEDPYVGRFDSCWQSLKPSWQQGKGASAAAGSRGRGGGAGVGRSHSLLLLQREPEPRSAVLCGSGEMLVNHTSEVARVGGSHSKHDMAT